MSLCWAFASPFKLTSQHLTRGLLQFFNPSVYRASCIPRCGPAPTHDVNAAQLRRKFLESMYISGRLNTGSVRTQTRTSVSGRTKRIRPRNRSRTKVCFNYCPLASTYGRVVNCDGGGTVVLLGEIASKLLPIGGQRLFSMALPLQYAILVAEGWNGSSKWLLAILSGVYALERNANRVIWLC